MKLETRPVTEALDTVLVHNIVYPSGRKAIRKGTLLRADHLAQLQKLGHQNVMVAVLEAGDVRENTAAERIARALQSEHFQLTRATGGRVNLQAQVDGLLEIEASRLLTLNNLPGITLATRPHHAVIGPGQATHQAATLKIIPYAIHHSKLDRALDLAPGILRLRALPQGKKAALLLTGHPKTHPKLQTDFEPPTRTRLERLHAQLETVVCMAQETAAIKQAAARLAETHDLLVIAGQTSIMDQDDLTPHALRQAGAEVTVHGAPVEPGNLMAVAYFPGTPVLCAPGCARSLNHNVVDLLLPRLLLGDHLTQGDIAAWGLGGLLEKVWL